MNSREDFLEAYVELETSVRQLMGQLFSDTCGLCTACCCRADICEETFRSAFLSLLLERQRLAVDDLDDRYGWLDVDGCTLEYGRPPVCYAYFCDQLLARLPDDETRHVAKVLGNLLEHAGANALDGWHLAEIGNAADLDKVDFDALFLRLEEAQAAFETIEQFFDAGRISPSGRETLEAITADEL